MINRKDVVQLISGSKDLINDQTWDDMIPKYNTTGIVFDASEGLGEAAADTTLVFVAAGGFPNQRITATLNYPAPTTAGNEEIGVLLRCHTVDGTDDDYYLARVNGQQAQITKVVGGSFTTMSQTAFALPQGQNVTITFEAVGDQLKATFDAGGSPATVNLSTTDSEVPRRGLMGFKSSGSTIWCRSISWEQLP